MAKYCVEVHLKVSQKATQTDYEEKRSQKEQWSRKEIGVEVIVEKVVGTGEKVSFPREVI